MNKKNVPTQLDHVAVTHGHEGKVITISWKNKVVGITLIAAGIFTLGLSLYLKLFATNSVNTIPFYIFIVLGGSSLVEVYLGFCHLYNKTIITIKSGLLKVEVKPVPWPVKREINTYDIEQAFVGQKVHQSNNGTYITYRVLAHLKNGKKVKIATNLHDHKTALLVEAEIEKHLNIKDAPVKGEIF